MLSSHGISEQKKLKKRIIPPVLKKSKERWEQEKEWARYLFKDGSMMGLNDRILGEYIEYIAGKRMRAIGIKNEYSKNNPLSWTDKYLVSADNQVAPQETEISSYMSGSFEQDLEDYDFTYFEF